jgi:hypothetical protein
VGLHDLDAELAQRLGVLNHAQVGSAAGRPTEMIIGRRVGAKVASDEVASRENVFAARVGHCRDRPVAAATEIHQMALEDHPHERLRVAVLLPPVELQEEAFAHVAGRHSRRSGLLQHPQHV